MKELPAGWERTTIGEVAEIAGGVQKSPRRRPAGNAHPMLRVANVLEGHLDLEHIHLIELFDAELERLSLEPGDCLVVEGNGSISQVGRAAMWRGEIAGCVHQNHILRARPLIDPSFLNSWMLSRAARDQIERVASSTSGLHVLSGRKLRQLALAVPGLREQERIVAAIEEHLSRLDAAEAAAFSVRQRLVSFEQRLVDAAVEGEPVLLGDLLREPLRNGLSAPASPSGSIRVVTLTAVTKAAFVDANTKLIEPGVRSVADLWMKPGDVFIQRSNTPELVGTAALFDGPLHWAIFPDLLIRVRVDETRADPSYLALVLRSTTTRRHFQRSAQGIAGSMPKISQPIVEAATIPLPSLERQISIFRRLSDDLTIARRMAAEVERAAMRARTLRRSILAAAFSGQLVSQDPDDEPASVLLQRIRAERAASPGKRVRATNAPSSAVPHRAAIPVSRERES